MPYAKLVEENAFTFVRLSRLQPNFSSFENSEHGGKREISILDVHPAMTLSLAGIPARSTVSLTGSGRYGYGAVFRLDACGPLIIMHSFNGGTDGSIRYGGLIRDRAGNLYGTTSSGGPFQDGTVYKLTPSRVDYRVRVDRRHQLTRQLRKVASANHSRWRSARCRRCDGKVYKWGSNSIITTSFSLEVAGAYFHCLMAFMAD